MKTSVTIGQIPTSWDIEKNLAMIDQVLTESGPDDVVLAPEGALSGYDPDLSPLRNLYHPRC
ncbi:hypothetical protein GA0070624_1208 [Micromonospora rhizosphaerae]|uniref:Carbon-nitrogen hydrolase n=1 Tax=Micromonospora rhizosphaerae TaxID=568872 RepID=A0A1C6RIS4_9ACTN|nr:hypothetical protein [Micromonospora rhizosphaerae]SCL17096.1 hypothetical protein GA0070624_1208 [Micromonospora rhizosphaerae]